MRACTASPTEISYNYSDNPDELYRAEVEFITADDWAKELQALYSDLLDGNGEVSRECTNQDSECGVAYAKIKAVYPKMTKEMIAEATPQSLANTVAVRRVLGTVKKLQATTAASLYRQLQNLCRQQGKRYRKDHGILAPHQGRAHLHKGRCSGDWRLFGRSTWRSGLKRSPSCRRRQLYEGMYWSVDRRSHYSCRGRQNGQITSG
jgi:hypothetical protein